MTRDELKEYLPHREPMLLIDSIDIDRDGVCHAQYRIKEDEFFCRGHFPGNPIVPGVIQCEIMPGDLCEVTAKLKSKRGPMFFCEAVLTVDGKLCCKGDLSFALA